MTYHRKLLVDEIGREKQRMGSAEANIVASELRYRSMVEQTPDAVYCFGFDPPIKVSMPVAEQIQCSYDATLLDCNKAFSDYFDGSSRAGLLGLRFGEVKEPGTQNTQRDQNTTRYDCRSGFERTAN